MNSLIECLLITLASAALSIGGLLLVRKKISRVTLEACHEVGGFMLSVVGTLYAILVGLIVVNSQGKVDEASQMAITEANMLTNIYHLSATFKQPAQRNIHKCIFDYANAAVDQDWTRVEQGVEDEATIPAYQALWKEVTGYIPTEQHETQCYATIISDMQNLAAARKYRMVAAKNQLSSVLWWILIAGGVMIILFTYFFFVENLLAQCIMTVFVSVFLSLNVYLIYICQNPYRPELGAKKSGFGFSFTPNWYRDPPEKNVPTPLNSGSK